MKVVDMFGSGVPVLAKNFACISELVEDKKNGYLFDTSKELADQLIRLATGFPTHCNVSFLITTHALLLYFAILIFL